MPEQLENTELDDEIEEEEEYEEEEPEELDPMDQEGWEHNIRRLNDL
jgi:hypothetical protein